MADNTKRYTQWNQETFRLLQTYKNVFDAVASFFSFSPQALAGAMVKENSAVQVNPSLEAAKDAYALGTMLVCSCEAQYYLAKKSGIIDKPLGGNKKLYYAQKGMGVMMDFGPFNTQGAQALRLLEDYLKLVHSSGQDPLGLREYGGKCTKFLAALAGCFGEAESIRLAAAIWGLYMNEAMKWFEEKINADPVSKEFWDGLSQEERDALYAQWCFCGQAKMEELYAQNKADNGGHYRPKPVEKDSGAWNVYNNSGRIGDSTGEPGYGINHGPGIPDNGQWQEEEEDVGFHIKLTEFS